MPTVSELKDHLTALGLSTSGLKADLVARLAAHGSASSGKGKHGASLPPPSPGTPAKKAKVAAPPVPATLPAPAFVATAATAYWGESNVIVTCAPVPGAMSYEFKIVELPGLAAVVSLQAKVSVKFATTGKYTFTCNATPNGAISTAPTITIHPARVSSPRPAWAVEAESTPELTPTEVAKLISAPGASSAASAKTIWRSTAAEGGGGASAPDSGPVTSSASERKIFDILKHKLDQAQLNSLHEFRLLEVKCVGQGAARDAEFAAVAAKATTVRLLYHGTSAASILQIRKNGFKDSKIAGATDKGFIGFGHYQTPNPEYACAYLPDTTPGVTHLKYDDPVDVGTDVTLVVSLVATTAEKRVTTMHYGEALEDGYDAATAWVTRTGKPTAHDAAAATNAAYVQEIVVRKGACILPRFEIKLRRVAKTLVWVDPAIDGASNDALFRSLQLGVTNTRIVATADPDFAYATIAGCRLQPGVQGKENTEVRVVTAGRGGLELLTEIRKADGGGASGASSPYPDDVPALVYCTAVDWHTKWATKLTAETTGGLLAVTARTATMKQFCSWWSGDAAEV